MLRLTHAKNLTACQFRFDGYPNCCHADHHATSKAAKLMPMARAVRRSRPASARAVSLALLTSG